MLLRFTGPADRRVISKGPTVSRRTQLLLYIAATACMAAAMGMHDSVFNNFLRDTYHLSPEQRGWLEFPREFPGFLVVFLAGILSALAVTRVAMVGALLFAGGLVGIAVFGSRYGAMVAMMMIASAGMHLLQPVGGSIALGLSQDGRRGRLLGRVGAVGTAGTVLGAASVLFLFNRIPHYEAWLVGAALLGLVVVGLYAAMHIPHLSRRRQPLVLRRRFGLYYVLEFLFGARKQVFLTFGPWVLIQVYGADARSMAGFLMTAALIGIVFQPVVGHLIDRFGERRVMIADGASTAVVCLGYGYALWLLGSPEKALPLASACYIADNLLFALGSARTVYVSRVAEAPEEITSTLALGVSINHIASMTIPAFAGAMWVVFGYERVFAGAAVLALALAVLALRVPSKRAWQARAHAPALASTFGESQP